MWVGANLWVRQTVGSSWKQVWGQVGSRHWMWGHPGDGPGVTDSGAAQGPTVQKAQGGWRVKHSARCQAEHSGGATIWGVGRDGSSPSTTNLSPGCALAHLSSCPWSHCHLVKGVCVPPHLVPSWCSSRCTPLATGHSETPSWLSAPSWLSPPSVCLHHVHVPRPSLCLLASLAFGARAVSLSLSWGQFLGLRMGLDPGPSALPVPGVSPCGLHVITELCMSSSCWLLPCP